MLFSFELLVLVLCVIIILCNKDKRENENPYLHYVELTLPSGMAINFVEFHGMPFFDTLEVWMAWTRFLYSVNWNRIMSLVFLYPINMKFNSCHFKNDRNFYCCR